MGYGTVNSFGDLLELVRNIVREELSTLPRGLPVARGYDYDSTGKAYTADGDDLPNVAEGHGLEHGKGAQIVFLPTYPNAAEPTLQINGGAAIPIRYRNAKDPDENPDRPNATLPLPAGCLLTGVPYTLTFCGKYWLVDSYLPLQG